MHVPLKNIFMSTSTVMNRLQLYLKVLKIKMQILLRYLLRYINYEKRRWRKSFKQLSLKSDYC